MVVRLVGKKYIMVLLVYTLPLLVLANVETSSAWDVTLNCDRDCVQLAVNEGIVFIDGRQLQIGVNKGQLNVVGNEQDRLLIENYKVKVDNLTAQINEHISLLEKQKERNLSLHEKIEEATRFANRLIERMDTPNNFTRWRYNT